tara:strand:- start:707 stop:922 length:216 start_codon:yes stop_codon:yes gene_type:complete
MTQSDADPDRPNGDSERLTRIETRLVKYQQGNAVALDKAISLLDQIQSDQRALSSRIDEVIGGAPSDGTKD